MLLVVVAAIAGAVFVLDRVDLVTPLGQLSSETPAMPCNGHELAEGFTYKFRDPHRGELVVFHARGHLGGTIAPDANSRQLAVVKRVIGVPGDVVTVRAQHVYVNDRQADGILTQPFPAVKVAPSPVLRARRQPLVLARQPRLRRCPTLGHLQPRLLVWWPLGHFGAPGGRQAGPPPGNVC